MPEMISYRGDGPVREAMKILAAALLLGLLYTLITGKGMFAVDEPAVVNTEIIPPSYVDYAEVRELYDAGNILLVDARSSYDYELGHITGSVNLPLKEFDSAHPVVASWDRDAVIVTYCDGQECNSSLELATKLSEEGFTNVKFFFGGWKEWVENDGPREGE